MQFERLDRRHDDDAVRLDARNAAFGVEELFRAEIGAEPRFRHGVIGEAHGGIGRLHAVAAVRDVGKRPAVDDCGRSLERLHEIGLHRVFQKHRHRPHRAGDILGADVSSLRVLPHDDVAQPPLEVGKVGREAQNRHHLARRRDVEMVLPRDAAAAAPDRNVDEFPIVHVHTAVETDAVRIDAQSVSAENMVVQTAQSRLLAEVMACRSPVKCRLMSAMGTTWA